MNKPISLPKSIPMREILKDFKSAIDGIESFDRYTPESRPNFIADCRIKIQSTYDKKMNTLLEKSKRDRDYFVVGIDLIKTGDLNKTEFGSTAKRNSAIIEYNSALMLSIQKPDNIESIISDSTKMRRSEFTFGLLKLLEGNKDISSLYQMKLERARKIANEGFGISELERQHKQSEQQIDECNDYISLLNSDIETFEQKATSDAKIDELMEQNKTHKEVV